MSGTTRFVGASIARMQGSVIEELLGMRRRIRDFNDRNGLRTALLYTGGWFLQWHEGPAEAIERTWEISRSHAGHSHPRVVHRSVGAARLVEPVQIAALVGPDKATDVARKLFEIESRHPQRAPQPEAIWRHFASPLAGRFAGGSHDDDHRAVAVVSEYTEAVELVKAIAERCRVPMNYQRFAGPDVRVADAGAAYVDIGSWGQRRRVQAISRHVLHLGVARLAFTRLDDVVVLASRRGDSARVLADALAPFLSQVRPEPRFHVAGLDGRSHLETVLDIAVGPPAASEGELP